MGSEEKQERFVHAEPYYDDAADLINRLAETVRRLGLSNRFKVVWEPRKIVERQARTNIPLRNLWAVYVVDHAPHLPVPTGLSSTPRITARTREIPGTATRGTTYEAFGQKMTLNQWAKAVGVSWPTLNARIRSGKSMEEALTELALKKAS